MSVSMQYSGSVYNAKRQRKSSLMYMTMVPSIPSLSSPRDTIWDSKCCAYDVTLSMLFSLEGKQKYVDMTGFRFRVRLV